MKAPNFSSLSLKSQIYLLFRTLMVIIAMILSPFGLAGGVIRDAADVSILEDTDKRLLDYEVEKDTPDSKKRPISEPSRLRVPNAHGANGQNKPETTEVSQHKVAP